MEIAAQLGCFLIHHALYDGPAEERVGLFVQQRYLGYDLEGLLVPALQAVEVAHILQAHLPETGEVPVLSLAGRLLELHDVQAGPEHFDVFEGLDDLRVFLLCDFTRDKDPQVPHVLLHERHDHLPVGLDLRRARVDIGDPVDRLLGRRDVVSLRGEDDDGRADGLEVQVGPGGRLHLPAGQLVAHEEIVDDPADLLFVHQEVAAPPLLELQEPLLLRVDVFPHVVILVPVGVRRVEVLEVLHEVGTVKLAVAHVAGKKRQPGAPEETAAVAHRVFPLALAPASAPVRHGRAVDHDGPHLVRVVGRNHHGGPAALAVSVDRRLGTVGVPAHDGLQELRLRGGNIQNRLPRLGLRKENHEVDGVPELEGHPHLGVLLEPPDPGTVPCAGIDDHEGPLRVIHLHAFRRDDPDQGVVDGTIEGPAVLNDLPLEGQEWRCAFFFMLDVVVAPLAKDVPEQHRALCRIGHVGSPGLPGIFRWDPDGELRIDGDFLHVAHEAFLGFECARRVESADLPREIEKIRCLFLLVFHGWFPLINHNRYECRAKTI